MWDLLMAASYLDVQSLYYSVCLFLAEQISEKDLVSEVREMFAIDMGEPPETRHSAAKKAVGAVESTIGCYSTAFSVCRMVGRLNRRSKLTPLVGVGQRRRLNSPHVVLSASPFSQLSQRPRR